MQPDGSRLAKGIMEQILKPEEKTRLMAILLLWLWWSERNIQRRRQGEDSYEVAYVAAAMADRFQAKKLVTIAGFSSGTPHRWRRPEPGVLKINSDGAFDCNTGNGGWGFIIRNKDGALVQAGARRETALQSAFHTELLG